MHNRTWAPPSTHLPSNANCYQPYRAAGNIPTLASVVHRCNPPPLLQQFSTSNVGFNRPLFNLPPPPLPGLHNVFQVPPPLLQGLHRIGRIPQPPPPPPPPQQFQRPYYVPIYNSSNYFYPPSPVYCSNIRHPVQLLVPPPRLLIPPPPPPRQLYIPTTQYFAYPPTRLTRPLRRRNYPTARLVEIVSPTGTVDIPSEEEEEVGSPYVLHAINDPHKFREGETRAFEDAGTEFPRLSIGEKVEVKATTKFTTDDIHKFICDRVSVSEAIDGYKRGQDGVEDVQSTSKGQPKDEEADGKVKNGEVSSDDNSKDGEESTNGKENIDGEDKDNEEGRGVNDGETLVNGDQGQVENTVENSQDKKEGEDDVTGKKPQKKNKKNRWGRDAKIKEKKDEITDPYEKKVLENHEKQHCHICKGHKDTIKLPCPLHYRSIDLEVTDLEDRSKRVFGAYLSVLLKSRLLSMSDVVKEQCAIYDKHINHYFRGFPDLKELKWKRFGSTVNGLCNMKSDMNLVNCVMVNKADIMKYLDHMTNNKPIFSDLKIDFTNDYVITQFYMKNQTEVFELPYSLLFTMDIGMNITFTNLINMYRVYVPKFTEISTILRSWMANISGSNAGRKGSLTFSNEVTDVMIIDALQHLKIIPNVYDILKTDQIFFIDEEALETIAKELSTYVGPEIDSFSELMFNVISYISVRCMKKSPCFDVLQTSLEFRRSISVINPIHEGDMDDMCNYYSNQSMLYVQNALHYLVCLVYHFPDSIPEDKFKEYLTDGIESFKEKYCKHCKNAVQGGHTDEYCPHVYVLPSREANTHEQVFYLKLTSLLITVKERFIMSKSDHQIRQDAINEIQTQLTEVTKGSQFHLFGSSANGFGYRCSDIDICLKLSTEYLDSQDPDEFDPSPLMKKISSQLRKLHFITSLQPILKAKVPIIKFCYNNFLEGDISVQNILAVENTNLIKTYTMIDERFIILGYCIKCLVKAKKIHDASKGRLSSYAYMLMLIHYLQQVSPPVLPSLQELQFENGSETNFVEKWDAYFFSDLSNLRTVWDGFNKNLASASELWIGMLRYYAFDFDFDNQVISIGQLAPVSRYQKVWPGKCIAIEDPFIKNHNLGKGLNNLNSRFIREVFIACFTLFDDESKFISKKKPDIYFKNEMMIDTPLMNSILCQYCNSSDHVKRNCPKFKAQKRAETITRLVQSPNAEVVQANRRDNRSQRFRNTGQPRHQMSSNNAQFNMNQNFLPPNFRQQGASSHRLMMQQHQSRPQQHNRQQQRGQSNFDMMNNGQPRMMRPNFQQQQQNRSNRGQFRRGQHGHNLLQERGEGGPQPFYQTKF